MFAHFLSEFKINLNPVDSTTQSEQRVKVSENFLKLLYEWNEAVQKDLLKVVEEAGAVEEKSLFYFLSLCIVCETQQEDEGAAEEWISKYLWSILLQHINGVN